ncbi:MAG: CCA tRNA nucleotidyltransferase [Spirulinaceae cyanobacterium]
MPQPVYLVGGAVRDALLGRHRQDFDLDFVVPENAVQTAKKIANYYQAGFVILDAQRGIARVVFPQGTLDFAQQEGDSLETDLRRRDFTINAIAYNPRTEELIDPLQGQRDLEKGWLKMVSPGNLADDPLRLLRGYRQASQLNFTIEPETRSTIRALVPKLADVAPERIQAELNYLLNSPQASYWLKAAAEDGLLSLWLGEIDYHSLARLGKIDAAAKLCPELPQAQLSLAKLACLVSPQIEEAQSQLQRLKYSRTEIKTISVAIKYLPRLLTLESSPLPPKEQYFFFRGVEDVFPTVAVLAVAAGARKEAITPLIAAYLNPENQAAHPTPLVTGNDLMESLNLPPSRKIGQLLTEIQVARVEGKIKTPEEALQFALSLLGKN